MTATSEYAFSVELLTTKFNVVASDVKEALVTVLPPGCKYAVVAYAHDGSRLMRRRPQRLARAWTALRRLLGQCKHRLSK